MQLLRRISWAQRRYLIHLTPSLLEKIVVFAQKISDFLGWKYIFSQFNFQEGVGWKPKSINISCTGGPMRTKVFSHGHKKPPNIPCNELLNWFILCALPSICTHLITSSGRNTQSVQATGNCPLALSPAHLAASRLQPCRTTILLLFVEKGAHICLRGKGWRMGCVTCEYKALQLT